MLLTMAEIALETTVTKEFALDGTRLSAEDIVSIGQLNAEYAVALDGLVSDSVARLANTFTTDGTFSIVSSSGEPIVPEVQGTASLIGLFSRATDVATTRHWYNNLLIEPDGDGARMTCYIIAVKIKQMPATLERSGIYRDKLVKVNGQWKFRSRLLVLDPGSPVGVTTDQPQESQR
jgi:hypothetical protein